MGNSKSLRVDGNSLGKYDPSSYTLIPLHAYDHTTRLPNGRTIKDGKRPIHGNWTKRPYHSKRTIRSSIDGNHNVGVRLKADQLVIDVDPRNGGDVGLAQLVADLGIDLDKYPHVITGSGGSHYYMSKPADVLVVDTLEMYDGVEYKSSGRQVVAAGSIHPETQKHYKHDPKSPALHALPPCPKSLLRVITRPERTASGDAGQYTTEQLAEALDVIDVEQFDSNDKWVPFMMACHHATAGEGRQEFIDWSTQDERYKNDAYMIGRRWDSLHADKGDGYTSKTLDYHLRKAGRADLQVAPNAADDFEDDLDEVAPYDGKEFESTDLTPAGSRGLTISKANRAQDTIKNAYAAIQKSGLQPEWNELKQNVVFRTEKLPWLESYGRVLNDHVLRLVRLYLITLFQGIDYTPSTQNLYDAIMTEAYKEKYNPVLEYLDALQWDGVSRIEGLFSKYFQCGDDDYVRGVSKCFMIGAVRRMRAPGSKFDTMPVLKGPQGWNKSTAIKVLFGSDWFSDADLGQLQDKDAAMKLRGIWVQEFAEVDSLNHAQVGTLKAFISRGTDRQRDPYSRTVDDAPRRCVFLGTVNEGGYLKDSTGARRFWPLELLAPIDLKPLAADRDQLWAEAVVLEAGGTSDVLPQKLWPVAAERQSAQTTADPWSDEIVASLEERAKEFAIYDSENDEDGIEPPPPNKVHTAELFDILRIDAKDQSKSRSQRLRTVMESLGWKHARSLRINDQVRAGYMRELNAEYG